MNLIAKRCLIVGSIAILCVALFSFSCSTDVGSANTAYADTSPAVQIPKDALAVTEALQTAFRSVAAGVLPAVVELDVIETKTMQSNPLNGFPFFFFGQPNSGQGGEQEYKQEALGSGVIVRRSGNTLYVLTNQHVVGKDSEISVKLHDGRIFKGKLVGSDERKDIALVSFESNDSSIPVVVLGDSDIVQAGDICFAMGTPLGFYSSVSQGIISATGRSGGPSGNISDFIQTDAAINQGNSGGPLVNIYGEVIGINTWIASQSGGSQGLGFSIPINNVKKAIDDFINTGKVTYGWLGVSLVSIDASTEKALGVEGKAGALASQIFMGSPADKAGMQPGDYVIVLNDKSVKSVDQLVRDVGELQVGTTAAFTVIRNGKEIKLSAKIEARNESTLADNSKLWPGFTPFELTPDLLTQLKLDSKTKGVVVANVLAKSPAAIMGLQSADVITKVNDTPVHNLAEFYKVLDAAKGKEVWYEMLRDGHTISTIKYKR